MEVGLINRDNYRLVKEFLRYLSEVLQLDSASTGRYWFYLRRLLLWADEVPLHRAPEIRPTLPAHLSESRDDRIGRPLAPVTLKKILQTSKRFFEWAKMNYPRDFREVSATWLDTLRPARTITPEHDHVFVTLAEMLQLEKMEVAEGDLALRRDQAGACLLFLSGMRAGALGSLPIVAVDMTTRTIRQWPSLGVRTKNSKSSTTYLLHIPELLSAVERWDAYIRAQLPPTAMWYTPIISQWGEQRLSVSLPGANRNIAIVKRMRKLFAAAGVPYKSPHKFRHGHAVYALQHARDMADYKAVSTNLMHSDIRVTDGIYAPLASEEVQRRIQGLAGHSVPETHASELAEVIKGLTGQELAQALILIGGRLAG